MIYDTSGQAYSLQPTYCTYLTVICKWQVTVITVILGRLMDMGSF